MMKAGNELMRQVREQLKLSQEQMAEHLHVSQRTISRIETGKRSLGAFEYFSLMEMAGKPTEDLSPLFLESKELKDFITYKELKGMLRDGRFSDIREILPAFEKDITSKQPFVIQFIAFVKIAVDEEMPHEEAIERLYEVLGMSVKNFDQNNIAKYRFTYNEVYILIAIAMRLEFMGRIDCAIDLHKGLIESRGNALASNEDKAAIFPALMFNLSNLLGKSKRYKEALKYCKDAHEICIKYKNYRLVSCILYNMACCYRFMGEEEQLYKTYLTRAYYSAYAVGDTEVLNIIKKEAEKFGLSDLQFLNQDIDKEC